jgi:hypothetical protein
VIERTFARLHGFRRLPIRWERGTDMYEAPLKLASVHLGWAAEQRLSLVLSGAFRWEATVVGGG